MDVSKTNYVEENAFWWCFWQKMKYCWEKTLVKLTVRDINFVDLYFIVGWALCGLPQPEHESVMPLLSLSSLNVLTH